MGEKPFKLLQARDKTGALISARMIGPDPEPFVRPLSCPYCGHEVTPRRAQTRTSTKGKPFVRCAHFALAVEKGRKAEHHQRCALRTDHNIHVIARRSHGLAKVKDDGLQLRLVLPKTTDDATAQLPPAGADLLPPPKDPTNLLYRTVEPALPPAVTSAVRIAQLLALCGNDPETVEDFTVRHLGRKAATPWTDFCFGPEHSDLARLYDRVDNKKVTHPVAVVGQVLETYERGGKGACRIAADVPAGAEGTPVDVYLRSDHPELLEPLTPGMQVLGLAAPDVPWKVWKPGGGRRPNLALWAAAHWQIAYWNVDDDGLPTPPRAPNPRTTPPRRRPPFRPTRRAGPASSRPSASRRPPATTPAPKSAAAAPPAEPPASPPTPAPAPQPATQPRPPQPSEPPATAQPAPTPPTMDLPPPASPRRGLRRLLGRWRRR